MFVKNRAHCKGLTHASYFTARVALSKEVGV